MTSREVFVTMLYRAACLADSNAKKAGEAALAKVQNNPSLRFGDVEAGSYYEEAVYWAKEAGVVSGVGDTMIGNTWVSNAFGVGRQIDRAQTVTMLYPQAIKCGGETFTDFPPHFYHVM